MAKRSINKPIILITQSNKFLFLPRNSLKFNTAWGFFEKTKKGSPEKYFVTKDGSLFQKIKLPKKYQKIQEKEYLQVLKRQFILKNGLYETNNGALEFPSRLYLEFIKCKNDKELSKFINKYDFCDFPFTPEELEKTDDPYIEIFTNKKEALGVNWLHIYRRQFFLKNIYENWQNNNLSIRDKHNLQEEISKKIFLHSFDKNSFPFKELADYETKYEFNMEDFFGFKKINKIKEIDGFIIFGHFALCCLELLNDIEEYYIPRFCKNPLCKKELPKNVHGSQKFCKKEANPKCYKQWRSEARRRDRRNQRLRKKIK